MDFKVGDVVILKSGGPKMTVIDFDVDDTNKVVCQWWDSKIDLYLEKEFNRSVLEIYQPTDL